MVKIVQKGARILREIAKTVPLDAIDTQKIKTILKNMKKALASQEDGIAIAAPQIGESLRIFVVSGKMFTSEEDEEQKEDKVFINPVIKKKSRKKESVDEGCLSVRFKYGMVDRAVKTTIRAYDENRKPFTYNATGLLSQIFQHETDHLEGILFIDKARDVKDIPQDKATAVRPRA